MAKPILKRPRSAEYPTPTVVSDVSDGGGVRVVTLEGRATRYIVIGTKLPQGSDIQGWLITLTYSYSPQASAIVNGGADEGPLFTHDLGDRMNLSGYDAYAVTFAAALITGREHVTL